MKSSILFVARCAAFFAALGTFSALPLSAQQNLLSSQLFAAAKAPAVTYSSSAEQAAYTAPEEEHALFSSEKALQPPPRRRYGRPTYHDGNSNPDGSRKYTFNIGGGMTIPVGDAHKYLTPSYTFQAGGGRNFSRTLGVLLQFEWDNFGFQGANLSNQASIEGATQAGIPMDGKSHIWSFTLNPVINYVNSDSGSAYVIVGGGFYHKNATFTIPATGTYCDFYGFCYQYQANAPIDKYNSNSGGVQGGLGFAKKLSRFGDEKVFLEAKYVYTFNELKAASFTNLYPANSHRTGYIPVTFGLRW